MEQWIKNISLVFLSAVVFLTGMGTTLMNFCCHDCANEFLSIYTPIESESIEEENHSCCQSAQEQEKISCYETEGQHQEEKCCKIERQSTDLYSYHSGPSVSQPYTWIASSVLKVSDTASFKTDFTGFSPFIEAPPDIFTPRTYLYFIRILII